MDSEMRVFREGDSVIALCRLGGAVGVASGSRGTVVRIRCDDDVPPYIVVFETDNSLTVEIDVEEHQIGRVASHMPITTAPSHELSLPPVKTRRLHRSTNRQAIHHPTMGCPHYRCSVLHAVQFVLWVCVYVAVLLMIPLATLLISGAVIAAAYLHQLSVICRWAWIPEFFQQPYLKEKAVVDQRYLQLVFFTDVAQIVLLVMYLAYHSVYVTSGYRFSLVPGFVLLAALFLMSVGKTYIHGRSTRFAAN